MSSGIVHILKHIKDEGIMREMLLKMTYNDLFLAFNTLEFLDEETEKRWLKVYNSLDKSNK